MGGKGKLEAPVHGRKDQPEVLLRHEERQEGDDGVVAGAQVAVGIDRRIQCGPRYVGKRFLCTAAHVRRNLCIGEAIEFRVGQQVGDTYVEVYIRRIQVPDVLQYDRVGAGLVELSAGESDGGGPLGPSFVRGGDLVRVSHFASGAARGFHFEPPALPGLRRRESAGDRCGDPLRFVARNLGPAHTSSPF